MSNHSQSFLDRISQIIYEKKGFNILALDVREVSTLTDYLIIAEGSVEKHVQAIAQSLIEELKKEGERPIFVEGIEEGDWVVLDYFDVIVHLFIPSLREKYQLEKLWSEGKILDLHINIRKEA